MRIAALKADITGIEVGSSEPERESRELAYAHVYTPRQYDNYEYAIAIARRMRLLDLSRSCDEHGAIIAGVIMNSNGASAGTAAAAPVPVPTSKPARRPPQIAVASLGVHDSTKVYQFGSPRQLRSRYSDMRIYYTRMIN